MAAIRGRDTQPELIIRRGLHARGFRFRLHKRGLPGRPDLVLARYRAVIFVNGCFWHGHDCPQFRWPKTREAFWKEKIGANAERDRRNQTALLKAGWRVGTVWECALKGRTKLDPDVVLGRLGEWLRSDDGICVIKGGRQDTTDTRA